MKKAHFSMLLVFSLMVCIILSCVSDPDHKQATMNFDEYAAQDQIQDEVSDNMLDRLEVLDRNDILLFELVGIKDVLSYRPPNEDEIELIVYETSTGVDFVKVCADKSSTGIEAEYAWAYYMYPEFVRQIQSLIEIKINGTLYYCDLLRFRNNETGEVKEIFFEISDFFGKW
jgi:hypothetical protein